MASDAPLLLSSGRNFKEYMSADEWGYWFEGKAAKGDIVNPRSENESAGAVRDGGSFYDRMGSVSCWNAVMEKTNAWSESGTNLSLP